MPPRPSVYGFGTAYGYALLLAASSSATAAAAATAGAVPLTITETSPISADGVPRLLARLPGVELLPMRPKKKNSKPAPPTTDQITVIINSTTTYQTILGFGGAFTEAAAHNWIRLSPRDRAEVMRLYFAKPSEGGHGYTLGRVPINSCDFSVRPYTFDEVAGDRELEHFDTTVSHDVANGIVPMIQAAQREVAQRGGGALTMFASPWSPPAWMKIPLLPPTGARGPAPSGISIARWWEADPKGKRSMILSDVPLCLEAESLGPWAKYFSLWIDAYQRHGIRIWAVTIQNEPMAAVGWESCLWSANNSAAFVRDHLGPVLAREQPGVLIIGYDHNKDKVAKWAKALYEDPLAAQYVAGVAVHWYGGLKTESLDETHALAPGKFILASEACNCGGVVFEQPDARRWWARAEDLALDILVDLLHWAVGWTDWNLILDITGGPNHAHNLCDANIIADPPNARGHGTLTLQASFYFQGHFSRFIPPGSIRTKLTFDPELPPPAITASDVQNGQSMVFAACDGNAAQRFETRGGSLAVSGTAMAYGDGHGVGICLDADGGSEKLHAWKCYSNSPNQHFTFVRVPNITTAAGAPVAQIRSSTTPVRCITAVRGDGALVGLDAGVSIIAARLEHCRSAGDSMQTFVISPAPLAGASALQDLLALFEVHNNGGRDGSDGDEAAAETREAVQKTTEAATQKAVRTAIPITVEWRGSTGGSDGDGGGKGGGRCMQPLLVPKPKFAAVSFVTPDGGQALVAMNRGDEPILLSLYDETLSVGATGLPIPAHSIQTYTWGSSGKVNNATPVSNGTKLVSQAEFEAGIAAAEAAAAREEREAVRRPSGGDICSDACPFAFDQQCDDGGDGSEFSICGIGTDCDDCGPRGRGHDRLMRWAQALLVGVVVLMSVIAWSLHRRRWRAGGDGRGPCCMQQALLPSGDGMMARDPPSEKGIALR